MSVVPDLHPTTRQEQTVAPTKVVSVDTGHSLDRPAPLKFPLSLFVFRDKQQSRDLGIRLWCMGRHESLSKCKGLSSLKSTNKYYTSFTHIY